MPVFGHLSPLQKLTGLIYFPITPTFPLLGLLGGVAYLPAKFYIRFLEPIPTDQWGEEPWDDKGLVQTVAEEVRARIQEELYDMLAERGSRCGSDEAPRPHHRPLQLLGRPARAGAREGRGRRGDHRRQPRRPDLRAGAHRVRPRRHPARAAAPDRPRRARSTPSIDTRLVVDSRDRRRPRVAHEMNVHRDDEHPRGVRRPGLAGAQGRLQVLRALLRLRARRPELLHRGHAAPAPAAHECGVWIIGRSMSSAKPPSGSSRR